MNLPRSGVRTRTSSIALALGLALASASAGAALAAAPQTTTPITHVVVIFDENISFDHYFATYPHATNPSGETPFHAALHTPDVNGINTPYGAPNNTNFAPISGKVIQPFRLDPSQATTCDEDHNYLPEQQAYHAGQNDLFVQYTGSNSANCASDASTVLGYFDGNTVTALWNYAQHFAINDNSYDTMYGPSAPGAVDLISGNTFAIVPGTADRTNVSVYGTVQSGSTAGSTVLGTVTVDGSDHGANTAAGSLIGDARPFGDDCNPTGSDQVQFNQNPQPLNIGDLLRSAGVTWGWFQGGFRATTQYNPTAGQPAAVCAALHAAADNNLPTPDLKVDYIAHHEPFQYFTSTQNLHHVPPASNAEVGHDGPANHQYDLADLFNITNVTGPSSLTYTITGLKEGVDLPAVTYLKAPGFMDGHPQYSNPLLEQKFVVGVINALMHSKYWDEGLAVFILYDDSDGWYDHVVPPLVNPSAGTINGQDALTGGTNCGVPATGAVIGRCGYGPRQPLMLISTYAKCNYVDHTVTDQTSTLRFIEDNWNLGRLNDPAKPVSKGGSFDQLAGSVLNMFDFNHLRTPVFLNDTDGTVQSPGNVDDCATQFSDNGFGQGHF